MIVVTQALWVGTEEEASKKDFFYALTPRGAVHIIAEGATAVIPVDGWEDTAREILAQLHSSPDQIEWTISFAKGEATGVWDL